MRWEQLDEIIFIETKARILYVIMDMIEVFKYKPYGIRRPVWRKGLFKFCPADVSLVTRVPRIAIDGMLSVKMAAGGFPPLLTTILGTTQLWNRCILISEWCWSWYEIIFMIAVQKKNPRHFQGDRSDTYCVKYIKVLPHLFLSIVEKLFLIHDVLYEIMLCYVRQLMFRWFMIKTPEGDRSHFRGLSFRI